MQVFLVLFACFSLSLAATCPSGCVSPQNGSCDTSTGLCSCNAPFTGQDCSIYDKEIADQTPETGTVTFFGWRYYHITIDHRTGLLLTLEQEKQTEDCDVYVNVDERPTLQKYFYRDVQPGALTFTHMFDSLAPGTWYVGIFGFSTACSYTLKVELKNLCGCENGGTCGDDLKCACAPGYAGQTCENAVIPLTAGTPQEDIVSYHRIKYYSSEIENGISTVKVKIEQDEPYEAVALFVRFGAPPTFGDFDARHTSPFSEEIEIYTPHTEGTWYFALYAVGTKDMSSSYVITVSYEQGEECLGTQCSGATHGTCRSNACACNADYEGEHCETKKTKLVIGDPVSGYVATDAWNHYKISSNTAQNIVLTVRQDKEGEDCDLYVKAGSAPTRFDYDIQNLTQQKDFSITITNPAGREWHLGVYGWLACSYTLSAELSSTCECAEDGHGICAEGSSRCDCEDGYTGQGCNDTCTSITSGVPIRHETVSQYAYKYYCFAFENVSIIHVAVKEKRTGDAYVVANLGTYPTIGDYRWGDLNANSRLDTLVIEFPNPRSGVLHIGVYGSVYQAGDGSEFAIEVFTPGF